MSLRKYFKRSSDKAVSSKVSIKRSLQFETLEDKQMLTTFLANFVQGFGAPGVLNAASASDFAAADPQVDLSTPVNVVSTGGGTGLAGSDGSTFNIAVAGASSFTTPVGQFANTPILDSYLFANNSTATVTISGLDEIADGELVTLTLFGVGDNPNQESIFTVRHAGQVVGGGETDFDASFEDTFITVSFAKQAGVDSIEVDFVTAGNGSATGAFNGFSLTTDPNAEPVPAVIATASGGSTTVAEGGVTDTVGFALATQPTANVIVNVAASGGNEVALSSTALIFTPGNFDQVQTITVAAVDDDDAEGVQTISLLATASSLDADFDGLVSPALAVTVVDNETLVPVDFTQRTIASSLPGPSVGTFGPDGRLYVATTEGTIFAFTLNGNNDVVDTEVIDVLPGEPNTILGIAFDPFEDISDGSNPTIYVSRTNLNLATTSFGNVVSTLSGPDFSVVEDIITGLPVSGFDHGINGLNFTNEGDLLINVGGNTNVGEFDGVFGSDAPESPFSGAILRASVNDPDFNGNIQYQFLTIDDVGDPAVQAVIDAGIAAIAAQQNIAPDPNNQLFGNFVRPVDGVDVEVFASGLRNSFDSVFTTSGQLFSTDNGPNDGNQPPELQAQDELNLVSEGDFLGHANIARGFLDPRQVLDNREFDPNAPSTEDLTSPLTALPSSTNGITEFRSEVFGGQLRGQLVAQQFNNQVFFFELTGDGTDLVSTTSRTDVADGLDIIFGPGGSLFGIDLFEGRVTVAEPNDPTISGPTALDILSFRGNSAGGNPFFIGGVNFDSGSPTTVTIGGVSATVTGVEEGRISGVLPPLPAGEFLDVVVTNGGVTSTITEAFLPVSLDPIVGDFNGDTIVDAADFDVFASTFGSTTDPAADANSDGVVNAADFVLFRDSFTVAAPAVSAISESTISESVAGGSAAEGASIFAVASATDLQAFSTTALETGVAPTAGAGVSGVAASAEAESADLLFFLAAAEGQDEVGLSEDGPLAVEGSAIDEALAELQDDQLGVDLGLS